MNRKILFSFICLALACSLASAEISRPNQCTAFLPTQVDKSIIKDSDVAAVTKSPYGQNIKPATQNYWHAYSDRSDNKTYESPSPGAREYSSLAFGDRVTIAAIKGDYALIIQDEKQDHWPNISAKAVVRGWIPMKNLLLWSTCPANQYGIYYKAVVCTNADAGNIKVAKDKLLKKFSNPDAPADDNLKADMRFYFVMKTEGNMALLATDYKMSGTSSAQLYGWADASSYVPWNQRMCLEPTWNVPDAEFFADKKINATVLSPKTKAKLVDIAYRKSANASGEFDPFMYRMDAYLLRYPILDGGNDKQFFCSAFANVNGVAPLDHNSLTPQYEKLNRILEQRKKVKIAIVIDGTASMHEYFDATRRAIVEGVKYFSDNTVQVGVVIYRDKEDGDYAAEILRPTDVNNPALSDFLKNGGKYGVKSNSRDKDMQEAAFYGIDRALDTFNFNPEESNIMLVIGDCGDNGKMGVKSETIVEKLIRNKVSFMGFQVRSRYEDAFQSFNDQMTDIMRNVIQGRYDVDRQQLSSAEQKQLQIKVRPTEVRGGYDMTTSSGTSLYLGYFRNAETGKEMPKEELVSLMENSFSKWKQSINKITDDLYRISQGESPVISVEQYTGAVNQDVLANKAAIMEMIGKDTYEALASHNQLVSFQGFTAKDYVSGSSVRPFYKSVVFISSEELSYIIEKLGPLYGVARKRSNSRVEYVTALKALVKSIIPGVTEQRINQMKPEEVMSLISGLPVTTGSMKYTIEDISDPTKVKPAEYLSLVNGMMTKYEKLRRTQGSAYQYSRKWGDIVYYWLPTEDLP